MKRGTHHRGRYLKPRWGGGREGGTPSMAYLTSAGCLRPKSSSGVTSPFVKATIFWTVDHLGSLTLPVAILQRCILLIPNSLANSSIVPGHLFSIHSPSLIVTSSLQVNVTQKTRMVKSCNEQGIEREVTLWLH